MDYGAILVSTIISALGVTIGTILQSLVDAYFFKLRERRRNQRAVSGESGITTSTANPTVANTRHNAGTKEIIGELGPWGDTDVGLSFDHNGYNGIKTIKIGSGWVIDSIEVQYIKRGELIWVHKEGGNAETTKEIVLEDGEYINEIKGFYGRLFGAASINSLTFFTNRNNKFGPYGLHSGTMKEEKEAEPTPFQVSGGKIVGFHGTSDRFISSIGFYVSPLV